LRAAHRHHIHVACLAWPRHSPLLFYLVAGAEAAIVEQGLELRKIDGLIESRDDGADDIPLDDYSSTSDSWLRGNDAGGSAGAGRGRRGEAASGTGSEPAEPRLTDPDVAAAVVQGAGHRHKAIELAQSLDSPTLAVELLELLAKGARRGDVERKIGSRVGSDALASVLRQLAADGHLRHEGGFMHLTEQGRALLHHFHRYHREIQMALRRAMRRMTRQHLTQPGRSPLAGEDRKSTRLNSSHVKISYAVFCLKKKNHQEIAIFPNRVNMNLFISKWDNFFILAPLILIQLHGVSRLINHSKYSLSHHESSWLG